MVEIPRSTLQALKTDNAFNAHLYNAILEAETTGDVAEVEIGVSRRRAKVYVSE